MKELNRRQFITFAAMGGAALATLPVSADPSAISTTPAKSSVVPVTPAPVATPEGLALADAAMGSVGYKIPADQVDEIKKQLVDYPGSFGKARDFLIPDNIAPDMRLSAALPKQIAKAKPILEAPQLVAPKKPFVHKSAL